MNSCLRTVSCFCTLVALLTACATVGTPPGDRDADFVPRTERCVRIDRIDNWRVIDNRQLIVFTARRAEAWHLKLFGACINLRNTEVLAFRARGSNLLCGDPGDEILMRGERCAVRSMVAVSPLEAEALLSPGVDQDIGKMPPAVPEEKRDK